MRSVRDLLAELRHRHVYRVAVAYGVVCWFVVQAASIVVPELELPEWITRAVIIVALLGFPLALVLAWAYDITPDGVRRTRGGPVERSARPVAAGSGRSRAPLVLLAVLGVAGIGMGAYTLYFRDPAVPRGEALYRRLVALADSERYVEAFDLARRAEAAGETVPDTLSARFTDRLSVTSDPPGARVSVLRFAGAPADTSARVEVGRTPLRSIPLARADYHVRIEADGRAPVERISSGTSWRLLLRGASEPEIRFDVRLLPAEQVPAGMVHVPGGSYQVASGDHQALTATLEDYFIDRFEVTHARFAEFVDAGGYALQEHWAHLADAAGRGGAVVKRELVDRTGMPGPRGWTAQQPPPELLDHPVAGVSWYEAAAYCRFRGARLPTLFEWEKAARDGARSFSHGVVLPWGYVGPEDSPADRANFGGTGTRPVGTYPFGVSAFGAWEMAGNVKEWLHNRSEEGRAVTGGAWADPIYVFSEVGSMDPAAAAPTLGFRCARTAASGRAGDQGAGPLRLTVVTPSYAPVDEATFRGLLSHYRYDPRPLDARVEERVETPAWTRERVSWAGPDGDRIPAFLYLPRSTRPAFQTIVYVPSSAAFLGASVPVLAEHDFGALVRGGRALFVVVMKGMTGRAFPPEYERPEPNSVAFRDLMVRHATELRMGLDYLETRQEIDPDRLAYAGTSWGAGSRLGFAATDDRFRAVVFIGAGIDERIQPTLPEASNINFAPYIRAPILMVNGREDEEHPWLTRALPLWNLLPQPKELALFDGVGHVPPPELRIPAIRDFLDRHLGR
jgi:eukaryotic-like serine/threonine-protein kinase